MSDPFVMQGFLKLRNEGRSPPSWYVNGAGVATGLLRHLAVKRLGAVYAGPKTLSVVTDECGDAWPIGQVCITIEWLDDASP